MFNRSLFFPVITLCFVQGIGNSLSTHIFPFIAAYFLSIGLEPSQVSTYSGIAESLIALVQLITLPFAIWAVKRFPHRWLLVFSLLSTGILAASFGLCSKPWQILLIRALTGAVNMGSYVGNIVLGQMVDDQSKRQAFSWFQAGNFLGAMGGAAVSGYLAEPAGRVPILGNIRFFQDYPYTLPGTLLLGMAILATVAVLVSVPETNHGGWTMSSDRSPSLSYLSLFKNSSFRQVVSVNIISKVCFFGSLSLMSTAGKLSPSVGGLGLSVPSIGLVFFITQLLTAVTLIVFFKRISDYLSLRRIVFFSSTGWLLVALFFPLANHFAVLESRYTVLIYGLWFMGGVIGLMWWPCQSLLCLALYPRLGDQAKASGAIRQSSNLATAFGAATYGRIFGTSSAHPADTVGRQGIWMWSVGFALLAIIISSRQMDVVPEKREDEDTDESSGLLQDRRGVLSAIGNGRGQIRI